MTFSFDFKSRQNCFCAFCKNPYKYNKHKHLEILTLIGLVLFSYILTYSLWHHPDPRGLFILAFLIFTGELISQARWRRSVVCKHCGFDPVLYVKNPEKAGEKIKEYIEVRKNSPEFLLKPVVHYPKSSSSYKNSSKTPSLPQSPSSKSKVLSLHV